MATATDDGGGEDGRAAAAASIPPSRLRHGHGHLPRHHPPARRRAAMLPTSTSPLLLLLRSPSLLLLAASLLLGDIGGGGGLAPGGGGGPTAPLRPLPLLRLFPWAPSLLHAAAADRTCDEAAAATAAAKGEDEDEDKDEDEEQGGTCAGAADGGTEVAGRKEDEEEGGGNVRAPGEEEGYSDDSGDDDDDDDDDEDGPYGSLVAEARAALEGSDDEEPCVDHEEQCLLWADNGECTDNADYMGRVCRKSCYLCDDETEAECTDLGGEDCTTWAKAGECLTNRPYMARNCRRSCGTCRGCHDRLDPDACYGWALEGRCTRTLEGSVYEDCPKACGICGNPTCRDVDPDECPRLAEAGECLLEYDAMRRRCPKSCRRCTDLDELDGWEDEAEAQAEILIIENYRSLLKGATGEYSQKIGGQQFEKEGSWLAVREMDRYLRYAASTVALSRKNRRKFVNHSSYCAFWAAKDRCATHGDFLKKKCPLACRAWEAGLLRKENEAAAEVAEAAAEGGADTVAAAAAAAEAAAAAAADGGMDGESKD